MTVYTEEMLLADAQQLHTDLENDPTNPSGTEPLTVGTAFPPGFRPVYNWSAIMLVGYTADPYGNTVGSTVAGLNAIVAGPDSAWEPLWVVAEVGIYAPAVTTGPNNWSVQNQFSNVVPMADALQWAADVEDRPAWQATWGHVQVFPRPLPMETPETATRASLGVTTLLQRAQMNLESNPTALTWFDVIPDNPLV